LDCGPQFSNHLGGVVTSQQRFGPGACLASGDGFNNKGALPWVAKRSEEPVKAWVKREFVHVKVAEVAAAAVGGEAGVSGPATVAVVTCERETFSGLPHLSFCDVSEWRGVIVEAERLKLLL
jgi:hypothetical protein